MKADTETRVRNLMGVIFKTELVKEGDIEREKTPAWDSLKNIELIFALEDEFGVVFSEDDAASVDSLSKIVRFVDANAA
jgi:acyl carrier protein